MKDQTIPSSAFLGTARARLGQKLGLLIINQFRDYWYWYVVAVVSLYMTHWIQSYLPFLAKELAERVESGFSDLSLWQFAWLALGIIVFRTASRLFFFYPARILQRNLRVELMQKLESKSPYRYKNYSPGQIFQVVGNDMEEIRSLVGFALLQVGNVLIALLVLLPKLIEFNPRLVIGLLPMFLGFVLFALIVSRNRHIYRKMQDAQGDVQNFIMESYVGKKTIHNYHVTSVFTDLFKKSSWNELLYFYRAGIGVAISIPLVPFGVGLSLLWGAHIIFQNDLGASSLVLFSGFVFLFLEPLMFLSWIGVVFTRSIGAWNRTQELVTLLESSSAEEAFLREKNESVPLLFHVDFWEKELEVPIKERSINVLVGATGEGKSHILKQLAEVFKIRRETVSYVSQSPYLYNDTIQGNIFLGHKPSHDELVLAKEYLQIFELDYLDKDLDSLLSLEVGENGKRLSGGQCKRLCLIRSLFSKAQVLLWDDPFSSVDVILERDICQKIFSSPLLKDKTVIMTSHRLTTARRADQLILINKKIGIQESGNAREQLLNKDGYIYAHFKDQLA